MPCRRDAEAKRPAGVDSSMVPPGVRFGESPTTIGRPSMPGTVEVEGGDVSSRGLLTVPGADARHARSRVDAVSDDTVRMLLIGGSVREYRSHAAMFNGCDDWSATISI